MSELNTPPSIEGLRHVREQLQKERQRSEDLKKRIQDLLGEIETLKLERDCLGGGTLEV